MASFESSLAVLALAMAMSMVADVSAQNTPHDFVNLHNRARAVDGGGPVVWDNTVPRFAQNYAEMRSADCLLQHSGGQFGENIFWGSGQSWTAAGAVNMWVDDGERGTTTSIDSNTCDAGKVCEHYTQVAWRRSTPIGCARVLCAGNCGVFIVCNYSPPAPVLSP